MPPRRARRPGDADRATLEEQLAAAILSDESLKAELEALRAGSSQAEEDVAALRTDLSQALAQLTAAQRESDTRLSEAEEAERLRAAAAAALSEEEATSTEAQRQVEALNGQVAELRATLSSMQRALDLQDQEDAESAVQIESLTQQLNTQAIRLAAERERRLRLEEERAAQLEAERERLAAEAESLAAEAQNLERYKSEFFGQMRQVVGDRDDIRIVGDRFVFSSEVLFEPGSADLSAEGEQQLSRVASLLREIAENIPDGIDWVIRVDGHTDDVGSPVFNWRLSQDRALSVVLYLVEREGIAPDRLSANGFGEYQPLNTEATPEARAQNRRIELKLTER